MARLTYLTPLMVGVLALAGCPASDDAPQETDSEGEDSTGTTNGPTTTPMTTTQGDSTSTTDDSADSSSTGMPDVCEPACDPESECCISGICFDQDPPACDPPCAEDENCVWPEGANRCPPGDITPGECVIACDPAPPTGSYDPCINDMGEPDETLCPADHLCLSGPNGESSCSLQGTCDPADALCTCPEAPDTGDATVTCADITMDKMPVNDCYLSCENDETCPDGMSCFGGFVCVTPIPQPQPGYLNCSHTGFMCQIGEDCLQNGDMMNPATWAVCSEPGCVTEMDCGFEAPSTGDAPVTCGDPSGGMGMPGDRCYLDCSAGQTCPDGMSCVNDTLCSWTAGETVFFDNFQTGDFSMGWTLANVDGLTPADPVSFVDDAWVVADNYDGGAGGNLAAYSNSWYTVPDPADDWMISPQIMIGPNARVEWRSRAQDPAYPDGFEVRVSTAGPDVADFTDPPIFTIPNEAATGDYVYHQVDLAAAGYADQMIYLAWRNNSTDQFVLLVDDIAVFNLP